MSLPLRTAAAIAILVIVAATAFFAFGFRPGSNVGPHVTPTPTTQSAPTSTPTAQSAPTASLTASPTSALIDTADWKSLVSQRYGFTIGHPVDWTEIPSDHAWSLAEAANWLSTGQDVFKPPDGNIRVSAWALDVDRQTTPETTEAVEAWITAYCRSSQNTGCDSVHARAVPLCVERRDCHPGLLVPFDDDVQAFMTGGIFGDRIVVVAVWWGESARATAPYGGSTRLLEGFLRTMSVWPESVPVEQRS